MDYLISFFESTFLELLRMGDKVIELMTKNLYDGLFRFIPAWVIDLLPNGAVEFLQGYTLGGLMFGTGVIVYIGFVIGKFLLK